MKKYIFNDSIKSELQQFRNYLEQQQFAKNTVGQKYNYAGYFLQWLETENLQPTETRYNDMLIFVEHCKTNGKSKSLINNILQSVRNYYQYLKTNYPDTERSRSKNPAKDLFLRGERQTLPTGIVPFQRLEELYKNFPTIDKWQPNNNNRMKRNRIILGLFIYQRITTRELHKLQPQHLKLKEGKIYIPSTKASNSRTLELKPNQIIDLHEYVTETRPGIIKNISSKKPARKPEKINRQEIEEQLFISINGSTNLKNSLLHLFKQVRKINPEIQSAKQIRASVIVNWLKNYNLRQVQYMAGHRYVSSTEHYLMDNLENLKEKINKLHPLG